MNIPQRNRDRHYQRIQSVDYFVAVLHQSLLALLLAKPFGLNALQIGLVLGVESAAQLAMEVPSGVLANGLGAGRAVFLGCLMNLFGYLAIILALQVHSIASPEFSLILCIVPLVLLASGASLLSGSLEDWARAIDAKVDEPGRAREAGRHSDEAAEDRSRREPERDFLRGLIAREHAAKFGVIMGASIGGLVGYFIIWAFTGLLRENDFVWSVPWIVATVIQSGLTLYVWRVVSPRRSETSAHALGVKESWLQRFTRLESEAYRSLVMRIRTTRSERLTQQFLISMLGAGILLFPVLWSEAVLHNLDKTSTAVSWRYEILGLIWLVTSFLALSGVALFGALFTAVTESSSPKPTVDQDAPRPRDAPAPAGSSASLVPHLHRATLLCLGALIVGCVAIAGLEWQGASGSWLWLLATATIGLGLARFVEGLARPLQSFSSQQMLDSPAQARAEDSQQNLAALLSFDSLIRYSLMTVLCTCLGVLGHIDRMYTWLGMFVWLLLCGYLLVARAGVRTFLFTLVFFVTATGALAGVLRAEGASIVHLNSYAAETRNSPGHTYVIAIEGDPVTALEIDSPGILLEDVAPPYRVSGRESTNVPSIVYHTTEIAADGSELGALSHKYRIEANGEPFQSLVVIAAVDEAPDLELRFCRQPLASEACKSGRLHRLRTKEFASRSEILVLSVLLLLCTYHGFRSILAHAVLVDREHSSAYPQAKPGS